MDCLPLEIIANIALYLPKWLEDNGSATDAQLARPASLSRKWQFSVEPAVFREIKLKSTELDAFASVFSTSQSHRRRLLKSLVFNIVLPIYSDDDCAMYETDWDRLANSKAASEAVTALFDVLSRWGLTLAPQSIFASPCIRPWTMPTAAWTNTNKIGPIP
jgi:hypothetical protein